MKYCADDPDIKISPYKSVIKSEDIVELKLFLKTSLFPITAAGIFANEKLIPHDPLHVADPVVCADTKYVLSFPVVTVNEIPPNVHVQLLPHDPCPVPDHVPVGIVCARTIAGIKFNMSSSAAKHTNEITRIDNDPKQIKIPLSTRMATFSLVGC